jgi:aminoglycoside phosphotransferase (APT) family kinase protein
VVDLGSLTPLAGGWSGRTFLGETGGDRQVVRILDPGDNDALHAQAALLRLVRGLLPVAEVLDVVPGDPERDRPGLLVTALVPGERGDEVLAGASDRVLRTVGRHVGDLAATLGGIPMLGAGALAGPRLEVRPFDVADLPAWVGQHLPALGHWSEAERQGLLAVAERAEEVLGAVGRTVLVHSDLNPKNLLLDPDTLEVTALLDWEFAHAGHPFTDLGNVLRFERQPAYVDAVLGRYAEVRGVDPGTALALARAADLWALVELAARRGSSPVADRAEALLRGVAGAGDAGWTPPWAPA